MFNKVNATVHINMTRLPELGLPYKEGDPIPLVISDSMLPGEKYDATLATQKWVYIWNTMMELAPYIRKSALTPVTVHMINDPWCFGIYLAIANNLHRFPELIVYQDGEKIDLRTMISEGTFTWNDGLHSK